MRSRVLSWVGRNSSDELLEVGAVINNWSTAYSIGCDSYRDFGNSLLFLMCSQIVKYSFERELAIRERGERTC